ncbi:ABC transporter ATP-binding protein [Geitlerinema sp. PCC 9228]|uniref:ABC transporter ATP-binding protein n=1 Tax=Geitlerinema sp. PCC 9228 TaxID=111611 RepID=UPI0008F98A83|nr:ABC transporter ATP-binding protein [Geitlerinema sp. PCC 9228]
MANVKLDRVTKRFDSFVAVDNLDIDIGDREFLVFVGPSGCGKTTTLRMLAGLEEVTEGHISINGEIVNHVPPKDRDIAMVFQSYALYPHMSVYENMAFSLQLHGVDKREIQKRVQAAAEQMGIEHLLNRKPKQLSGGQRQRVAVCRAIVRNPAVFLMDEPLSNLDAKLRVQARAEIGKLHKDLGATFVYVTHDQVEAMTMGTRIAVLNGGILQQIDTPENLYNHPQNVFVAGFMGSPAMNFFDAQLVEGPDGQLFVATDSFKLEIPEEKRELYLPYKGYDVIFGIRPENIHDPNYTPMEIQPVSIQAEVTVTETLGNENIVYLKTGKDREAIGRFDPRSRVRVGDKITATVDMSRFHIFEKRSQEAIASEKEKQR